ncbi:hypothetical protein H9Q08_12705 [Chryseobacterium sp. PS-8]|uniref:TonB-dependent receptor plug domain-containing protein n=1 Tax=Chryseobacterium indicum TaxID=2766954 RepID=A0ABS9C7J1_9FLAO|nr:hypothetical protein [Chryseobacterium sp. PS-8]MCF2220162.1 hypothetical protein [Chryseobacterium sp. PS-8]
MKINIDKPCSENWDSMQDDISGKFCAKCHEIVEDFTNSTPDEIAQKFFTDKKFCGKFTLSQLEQNYTLPWVKIMITALLTSGTVTLIDAQKIDSLFQKSNEQNLPSEFTALSKKVSGLTINTTQSNPNNETYDIKIGHPRRNDGVPPLIIIDGVESTAEILRQIPPDRIENITSLLAFQAVALYKKKGEHGAIIITLKK